MDENQSEGEPVSSDEGDGPPENLDPRRDEFESAPVLAETAPSIEQRDAAPSPPPSPPLPLRETALFFASIVAFDFCMYPHVGGTGYGVFMILWAFGFRALSRDRPAETLPLFLLALGLAARNIWQTGFLAVVLAPMFVAATVVLQRTEIAHVLDALWAAVFSPIKGLGYAFLHLGNTGRLAKRAGGMRSLAGWFVPAFAGLAVLFIFGGIFVRANPVVERIWNWIYDTLSLQWVIDRIIEILTPNPIRIFYWCMAAVATAGLLAPVRLFEKAFAEESQHSTEAADESESSGRTSLVALAVACALFAAYIAIDVNYLWIRSELPPGISDSDYARHGTFWLTIALILSTLVIGVATAQSQLNSRWISSVRRLAQSWVALDLLMAACVLGRIRFYIDKSGLTPLRITGIFGTLVVVCGVAFMSLKIARRRNLAWLIRRYAAAYVAFLAVFTIIPRDTISSWYNVRRVRSGDVRPLILLFRSALPVEGLTEYVDLLDHSDPIVARGIAAYLAERRAAYAAEERKELEWRGEREENWREVQIARSRAAAALADASPRLRYDDEAVRALAEICGGVNDSDGRVEKAWKTGKRSDLEWIDD